MKHFILFIFILIVASIITMGIKESRDKNQKKTLYMDPCSGYKDDTIFYNNNYYRIQVTKLKQNGRN